MSDERWDGRKSWHGYRDQSVHGPLPGQGSEQRDRGDEREPDTAEQIERFLREKR